ncbi:tRNA (guanosine(46)-N7)-methyltransferase TrmB [Peptoniphilus equinus]|uniref:tRNA (guanine-N(7)-)-methyltransferase n=1 Tax=Peptoniphilus equinus TaxID=3016343 RepID=A0ABY7QR77_9FIRM|nr:tRNA (guanosine(46)-N7)-methyltransferase TrmB [Peptoniphilus equinus]WBW49296.1 tRNA (guanosine(46)-N7)-methyltransferase TrmB [Peptoniphilus equinus]
MRLRYKPWAIPEMEENAYITFEPKQYAGSWHALFENNHPIYVEIGSGKGKFLQTMSERHPDTNYVGIEMDTNAFIYAARKLKEAGHFNVRGIAGNANAIDEYFGKDEVAGIYINFCNPWPKKRHHKRRLTHPRFLEKYKQILQPGSYIELKTDDLDFFEASLEYFKDEGFSLEDYTFDMKTEDYPDAIITEYESKWRSRGIPIKYVKARL